jgi:5'-3' exonuclease
VQSWSWFYPHHYAPFPRDLLLALELMVTEGLGENKGDKDDEDDEDEEDEGIPQPVTKHEKQQRFRPELDQPDIRLSKKDVSRENLNAPLFTFEKSAPLSPFQQLIAVLPPESASSVPESYRSLMLDPQSPIAKFYPKDIKVDVKRGGPEWHNVVLLEFFDVNLLVDAFSAIKANISPLELKRNSLSHSLLYAAVHLGSDAGLSLSKDDGLAGTIDSHELVSAGVHVWSYHSPSGVLRFGLLKGAREIVDLLSELEPASTIPFMRFVMRKLKAKERRAARRAAKIANGEPVSEEETEDDD